MLSMFTEVERITKQYNGLLLPGAYSHLTLQTYEQDLIQRLDTNPAVKLLAKQATLLFYSSRYLFRSQMMLYTPVVTNDFKLLCIAFFTVNKTSDSLHFDKFCLITRLEWERATITDLIYRTFWSNKLTTIDLMMTKTLPLSRSLAYSSDSISMIAEDEENEEECNASDVPANQFRLFWLHESLSKEEEEDVEPSELPENEYLTHYTVYLIDVLVWQRYFSELGYTLKKRMLHHYASVIGEHHSVMTLLFITQMIEHSSGKLTRRAHQTRKDCDRYNDWFIELSETLFYRQWLDAELFLFKNGQWHKDLFQQTRQIQEHIHFIEVHMPSALHNNWISYTVNNNRGMYWLETSVGLYQIAANWLFKPEFSDLLQVLPIEEGYTYISTQVFQTVFMPTLYRYILEDVYRCLFFLHHQEEEAEVRNALLTLRQRYQYKWNDMIELHACLEECNISNATSIYDCVATLRSGNVNSPATKKMLKRRTEFDLSKSRVNIDDSKKVPWYERVITRNDVPDIEDLGEKKLVPPCMTRIFDAKQSRPYLGHTDRLNAVRYLIDMAYTKKEVIHFLCQGFEQNASYMVEIAENYDRFARVKRINAKQLTSQHHSFGCRSIINTVPTQKEKNPLRCPYADKACGNSVRRKDFSKEEVEVFTIECGKTLNRPPMYGVKHPVNFYLLAQIQDINT